MSVAIRNVERTPVERSCRYSPVEPHVASVLKSAGSVPLATVPLVMPLAARLCASASSDVVVVESPAPPATEVEDHSFAAGWAEKALV